MPQGESRGEICGSFFLPGREKYSCLYEKGGMKNV